MSWILHYSNMDGSNEQSVDLEGLGALEGGQVTGDGIKFRFSSHKASEMTIRIPNVNPISVPQIPFGGRVRLVDSGGVQRFVGRRVDWSGEAQVGSQGFTYTFQDAWWDLTKITFKHEWFCCAYMAVSVSGSTVTFGNGQSITWSGQMPSANFYDANFNVIGSGFNVSITVTSATSFTISGGAGTAAGAEYVAFIGKSADVVLFQYMPTDPYQDASQVVDYYITTGEQIVQVLNFAIANGVQLQVGQIDPDLFVPWYPVRCQNCAECIKVCLRDHPDCFTEIDYSTTPPTFNVRKRSSLTPKVLPYAYTDANGIQHQSTSITPRPDLVPTRIGIFYRYMMNGQTVATPQDIYPASAPDGLLAIDYMIDLQGPRYQVSYGRITSGLLPNPLTTFNPSSVSDWWLSKHPEFKNNTSIHPTSGTIEGLAMCDASGDTANPTVTVTDSNGDAIDTGVYQWEMIGGGEAMWMTVGVKTATVQTWFNYSKRHVNQDGTVDATMKDETVRAQMVCTNVVLVNTPSIEQTYCAYLTTGEAIPSNLAQSIYESLQTMQYSLSQSQREEPFTDFTKPGKHCVNLSGGNPQWSAMNATVQETTYTIHQRPDGVVWAASKISCGPVEHLEAGQLVQLFNMFANRDLSKIDPWERITGSTGAGTKNGAPDSTSKENSTKLSPAVSQTGVTSLDASNTGYSNNINTDAATGLITMTQINGSNTAAAIGMIAPEYTGAGAPTGSGTSPTLPAGSYYRAGVKYVDTTSSTLYRCTTDGTSITSTWDQISVGIAWQDPKELDPTVIVYPDTLVYISPNNPLATAGMFDIGLGVNVAAAPGIWIALKTVPAQTTDSPPHYNVPQAPAAGTPSGTPMSGDLDATTLFWARIEKSSTC